MAARFWVGGTGNWDASTTTNWAATSGGLGGQSVPTSSDDVTFDTLSNATAYTVTITATANCANLTIGAPLSGAVTWAGSSSLNIFGNLNLSGGVAGITRSYTGTITFSATSTGQTITMNSITLGGSVNFTGLGGGWTLQDNFGMSGQSLTLTAGSLDTNGKTVTAAFFTISGSSTKSLTLGASTLTLNIWSATSTAFTLTAGTSTIALSAGSGTPFGGAGLTYNIVTLTNTQNAEMGITGANTFTTLTITGPASALQVYRFSADQVITGTFTANGSSAVNRLLLGSDIPGTQRTFTVGTASITNCDFGDIVGAGAVWSGTSIGNAGGNSGITFTTSVTRYWVATSGGNWNTTASWSASSGGASGASVPLIHDTVIFDANSITSGGRTITANIPRLGDTIDFTSLLNSPTFSYTGGNTGTGQNNVGPTARTNITFISGMTITSSTNVISIWPRSNISFSCPITMDCPLDIFAVGATVTFGSNFTLGVTRTLTLEIGTLNLNGKTVSTGLFASSSSTVRGITFSGGIFEITATSASTVWNIATSTNASMNISGGGTIKIDGATTNARTFSGGSLTYPNLWFTNATANGQMTIAGSNTFSDIKCTDTNTQTILFTVGTTTTVNTFTLTGAAGNLITINSSTTGTHALVKTGGGTVSCDYLNIQHSVATPLATWYAGNNSVNNQSVATAGSGWTFSIPPATSVSSAASLLLL